MLIRPKLIIILLIAIQFFLLPLLKAEESFLNDAYQPSPLASDPEQASVHKLQETYHKIYNMYADSVVFISTEKTVQVRYQHPFMNDPFFRDFFGNRKTMPETQKQKGLGTGFILSKDGYICTNHHVVADIDTVTVTVGEKKYKAKIIGSDPLTDIALLKIDGINRFKPVHLGDSDKVKIGDISIAIGNPFGLDRTYTSGIISAIGRKDIDKMGNSHIQTDAPINQGNSGGPLINIDGEVIGVNRAIYSTSGGSVGIGFAIPINTVKETLIQLKAHGKIRRGYLGVQISPLTEEFAKELGLKKAEGALVGGIIQDGPAYQAGLRVKDVILEVKDQKIKDFTSLLNIVSKLEIGKTVKITAWRDKQKINFWVTVKERS